MAKPPRERTARRQQQRERRGLVQDRERLAAMAPGGSPGRPIVLGTAALVEGRARTTPCPQCGGELHVLEHAMVIIDDRRLREARMRCQQCGVPRSLWFTLDAPLAN